jgi:hypothetical protein
MVRFPLDDPNRAPWAELGELPGAQADLAAGVVEVGVVARCRSGWTWLTRSSTISGMPSIGAPRARLSSIRLSIERVLITVAA